MKKSILKLVYKHHTDKNYVIFTQLKVKSSRKTKVFSERKNHAFLKRFKKKQFGHEVVILKVLYLARIANRAWTSIEWLRVWMSFI